MACAFPIKLYSIIDMPRIVHVYTHAVTRLMQVTISTKHGSHGIEAKLIRLLFQIQLNHIFLFCQRSHLPLPSVGCQGGQLLNTPS